MRKLMCLILLCIWVIAACNTEEVTNKAAKVEMNESYAEELILDLLHNVENELEKSELSMKELDDLESEAIEQLEKDLEKYVTSDFMNLSSQKTADENLSGLADWYYCDCNPQYPESIDLIRINVESFSEEQIQLSYLALGNETEESNTIYLQAIKDTDLWKLHQWHAVNSSTDPIDLTKQEYAEYLARMYGENTYTVVDELEDSSGNIVYLAYDENEAAYRAKYKQTGNDLTEEILAPLLLSQHLSEEEALQIVVDLYSTIENKLSALYTEHLSPEEIDYHLVNSELSPYVTTNFLNDEFKEAATNYFNSDSASWDKASELVRFGLQSNTPDHIVASHIKEADYDRMGGTVSIDVVKEDGQWKFDGWGWTDANEVKLHVTKEELEALYAKSGFNAEVWAEVKDDNDRLLYIYVESSEPIGVYADDTSITHHVKEEWLSGLIGYDNHDYEDETEIEFLDDLSDGLEGTWRDDTVGIVEIKKDANGHYDLYMFRNESVGIEWRDYGLVAEGDYQNILNSSKIHPVTGEECHIDVAYDGQVLQVNEFNCYDFTEGLEVFKSWYSKD
ncbi:hypothetical protein RYX45_14265 [Alkalihalophilus pseudofirmus]|uniref:Uncharacterized protein n=1 Tax=Alkalihalophilus pseudofirmus TaxID=79885 RepID=A0AAJ2U377_ALKPS|nr:hypothetical protein [Alkalihalophilus pseudofirmus]MDV2886351.1 hypothetical protein [Alkalihalophilus pseudofirmus]